MNDNDELWDMAEMAARVKRPIGTARQWRHRGFGPKGFRVGNRVMYRRSEVERWLDEQERAERVGGAA
jgi:hypothetical protein